MPNASADVGAALRSVHQRCHGSSSMDGSGARLCAITATKAPAQSSKEGAFPGARSAGDDERHHHAEGRLIKKIHGQLATDAIQPPRAGTSSVDWSPRPERPPLWDRYRAIALQLVKSISTAQE